MEAENVSPALFSDLVELGQVAPSIQLDLKYATPDNFLKEAVYSSPRCLVVRPVAEALAQVQLRLTAQGLGLKIFDAYRPLSIQCKMWKLMPDPRYVAPPYPGSRHNRGTAVDLTLVDAVGRELEMPSAYDEFSERAHRDYTNASPDARNNALLLELIMSEHGFVPWPHEWWHFDFQDWAQFPIVDLPL